jgi:myosin heavy subunit
MLERYVDEARLLDVVNIFPNYVTQVRYTADGFAEKNMESLSTELKELGDSSSVELARAVYGCVASGGDSGGNRRSSIRGFSVASQFKLSLQSLVEDLERTQPHYIRCIKPNLNKAANSFAAGEVLKQLRYSGMMEAIRIRREGYALREDHQSFYNRFCVLLDADDLEEDAGIEHLVKVLSKRLSVTDADWQMGHSKIFLRRELSEKLERLAKLRVYAAARALGRFGKRVVERRLSSLLVNWVRFRLVMLRKYRMHRAGSKLSSLHRMRKQVKLYKATRLAIIKIQSLQRRRLAAQVVRKIRDPFCDMSYKDLKQLWRAEKERMADAVNCQDFRTAAEIEAKM